MSTKQLNFDEFFNEFQPKPNHLLEPFDSDMHNFETYGKEVEYVASQAEKRLVWTAMDSEDGDYLIFVNGMAYVNRLFYYVCTKPYDPDIHYTVIDN